MKMTNQDYGKLVKDRAKPSPMGKNILWAFLVGGSICTVRGSFQQTRLIEV